MSNIKTLTNKEQKLLKYIDHYRKQEKLYTVNDYEDNVEYEPNYMSKEEYDYETYVSMAEDEYLKQKGKIKEVNYPIGYSDKQPVDPVLPSHINKLTDKEAFKKELLKHYKQ